ncbi:MAG: pilus assembly protein TadG-related protein [Candidatus Sulfotelmatobacter sp.]
MKKPAISRSHAVPGHSIPTNERGITMVLVAVAMVAIVAMAALSIDIVTLYLDKEEAQRSADAAALAAARVLSVSGITGDPSNSTGNWGSICGPGGMATLAAQAVVGQNTVSSAVPGTINISYSAGISGTITSSPDCQTFASTPPTAFGVNPLVTVKVTRSAIPTFFSRIWGNTSNSVSATATAEAFNPSNSGTVGNQNPGSGIITPVQPMCVKPWVVPNQDPLHPVGCSGPGGCDPLVNATDGSIRHPGITLGGFGTNGVIGENFWLTSDCQRRGGGCTLRNGGQQPQANYNGPGNIQGPPNLLYVPGQVAGTPTAVPSCSGAEPFELAITGCDQPTNYQCGVQKANWVDLSINPNSPTTNGVQCLINQADSGEVGTSSGQDYLNPFAAPGAYPFQILAGSGNPLTSAGLTTGTPITSSSSIVALPIYDSTQSIPPNNVTFVGFLQVFINAVDNNGNVNVTVLNVAGCSNNASGAPIPGTSPVPVRLITPP